MRCHRSKALLFLLLLAGTALGSIEIDFPHPHDEFSGRRAAFSSPEFDPYRQEFQKLIETKIIPLKFTQIKSIFGMPLPKLPDDAALPIYARSGVGISGLRHADESKNRDHIDFYAVDHLGYLQVIYHLDGESAQAAVFYHKIDSGFTPIKSESDYKPRLAWDLKRMSQIKTWLDKAIPSAAIPL